MGKQVKLLRVLSEMKRQVNNKDFADAHYEADDLLQVALYLLAEGSGMERIVKEILDCYDEVGKWYD